MKIIFEEPAIGIKTNSFMMEQHYYHKVLNAQIHQLVRFFLNMDKQRIIERYCHLNPLVNKEKLDQLLSYKPQHVQWSGTDLFHVTTEKGNKRIIVIENNSSPSGQKSMPLLLNMRKWAAIKDC
ncbi:MAG: hypothetical protein PF505_04730 [Vallitaleaceae bacterium]|jgi:hypothetical protein|nr:hypothetical protein [Vallitaleaceae bacterium]